MPNGDKGFWGELQEPWPYFWQGRQRPQAIDETGFPFYEASPTEQERRMTDPTTPPDVSPGEGYEWSWQAEYDPRWGYPLETGQWMPKGEEEPETSIRYETVGGALYEVVVDRNTGQEISRTFVSWAPREATAPAWRPGELELQQQQLAWQMRDEDREIRELEWELEKQRMLAELTGPADWIRRYQLMQMPTPWEHWSQVGGGTAPATGYGLTQAAYLGIQKQAAGIRGLGTPGATVISSGEPAPAMFTTPGGWTSTTALKGLVGG